MAWRKRDLFIREKDKRTLRLMFRGLVNPKCRGRVMKRTLVSVALLLLKPTATDVGKEEGKERMTQGCVWVTRGDAL